MGWNDHIDDSELGNLPPEAHGQFEGPFDPNDRWLESACKEDQIIAMREWFLARFCDPAMETPYNGREGGYLFIHGGPFDPADELPERFSRVVDEDIIAEVIEEMHETVGDQWAPSRTEIPDDYYDYDERFDLVLKSPSEPLETLKKRLQQIESVLTLTGAQEAMDLAPKLAFSAAIGALEAFLWETVEYWVENEEVVLRNLVTKIPYLRDQQMKLGDIFEQHKGLKDKVKGYLQNIVWHRWKVVAPLLKYGLEIQPPSFKTFDEAIEKRHHIVHRIGHDMTGAAISVPSDDVIILCENIKQFANQINDKLASKYSDLGF